MSKQPSSLWSVYKADQITLELSFCGRKLNSNYFWWSPDAYTSESHEFDSPDITVALFVLTVKVRFRYIERFFAAECICCTLYGWKTKFPQKYDKCITTAFRVFRFGELELRWRLHVSLPRRCVLRNFTNRYIFVLKMNVRLTLNKISLVY